METNGPSPDRSERATAGHDSRRLFLLRTVIVANTAAGLIYLAWRYAASVNPAAIALAVVLLAAETYGFLDFLLYALAMWKPLRRTPLPPIEGATVDVFITTYNEPAEIVRMTAEAAVAIDWKPLLVHILDDGARDEIRELAEKLGCGYITRGEEWKGRDRHAKAGNVNNALSLTGSEFVLILDADQIPDPEIVRRTIGYFRDPRLAFVQTPQSFYNLPPGDPFGSDAPLFYGPIMRGKDGWNAAFFCGSNALLRREALMQTGLVAYAAAAERAFRASLRNLVRRSRPAFGDSAEVTRQKRIVRKAAKEASALLDSGESMQSVTAKLDADLAPTRSAGTSSSAGADFGIARMDEAIAVEGVSTVSVTEDMATALRLHAAGWKSAFHAEILAHGLAPEDLGAALSQRLRWAQGTLQVMIRDSPLTKAGLSLGQRLMYFSTIFSYFSGFASFVFVFCPLIFLLWGVSPIRAWNFGFFIRFLPFYLLNRLMFLIAAEGLSVRRGEQYNLGLFPLWIKAVIGVLIGKKISFSVTPKTRDSRSFLSAIKPQIAVLAITAFCVAWASAGYLSGARTDPFGLLVNAFWACRNAYHISFIVRAARYSPPEGWQPIPPNSNRTIGRTQS